MGQRSRPRPEALLFWTGLAALGTAFELWGMRTDNDRTLSVYTRDVFRTDTRTGRIAFTLAWGGLNAWYAHHILTQNGAAHAHPQAR